VTAGAAATPPPPPLPAGWRHPSRPGPGEAGQAAAVQGTGGACAARHPSPSSSRRTLAAAARIGVCKSRLKGGLLSAFRPQGHPPLRQSSEAARAAVRVRDASLGAGQPRRHVWAGALLHGASDPTAASPLLTGGRGSRGQPLPARAPPRRQRRCSWRRRGPRPGAAPLAHAQGSAARGQPQGARSAAEAAPRPPAAAVQIGVPHLPPIV